MHPTHEPFADLVSSCTNKYSREQIIRFLDGDYDDKTLSLCFEQWSYGNAGVVADILNSANPKVKVLVKLPSGDKQETIDNPNYDANAKPKAELAA